MTEAGYKGERVALIVPTDFPNLKALADVGADMLQRLGMTVDYQAMDWGTLLTRRARKEPVDQGGWSAFFTFSSGADMATPAGQLMLRGIGERAWFGWPTDPELERLRDAWLTALDPATQKQAARQIQERVFETVPFVPLGQYFQPTAYRKTVRGILDGFATFWNVTLDA